MEIRISWGLKEKKNSFFYTVCIRCVHHFMVFCVPKRNKIGKEQKESNKESNKNDLLSFINSIDKIKKTIKEENARRIDISTLFFRV